MNNKILIITPLNSVHSINIIRFIKEFSRERCCIITYGQEKDIQSARIYEYDLPRLHVPSLSPFYIRSFISNIIRIKYFLSKEKPNIIHLQQIILNTLYFYIFIILIYRAQWVFSAWGSDILITTRKSYKQRLFVKYLSLNSNVKITADSTNLLHECKQYFTNHKIYMLYLGPGLKFQQFNKENIIYSNRLHSENYNIDKVIQKFSNFLIDNSDWKLIIAGTGPLTNVLKNQVESLGIQENVKFIGFVDFELNNQMYCRSKIYISIPKSDGGSVSLVEAISKSCIPIVSNIESNLELVKHRQNGLVIGEDEMFSIEDIKSINVNEMYKLNKKIIKMYSNEHRIKVLKKIYTL